jgi:hypothetical protein
MAMLLAGAASGWLIVMGDCVAIDSKQFAQLNQMLGIFANDQGTVSGEQQRKCKRSVREADRCGRSAASIARTQGNHVSL